jgi:hypothetical protein
LLKEKRSDFGDGKVARIKGENSGQIEMQKISINAATDPSQAVETRVHKK